MASKNQTITISTGFKTGVVDPESFRQEILTDQADPASVWVIALETVSTDGVDTCLIDFKVDISNAEVTRLNELAMLHEGAPVDVTPDRVELIPSTGQDMVAVSSQDIPPSAANLKTSWQLAAPAQTLTNIDIQIGGDLVGPMGICYLSGGTAVCRTPATIGSTLHLSLVDRDNTSGIFPLLGYVNTRIVLTGVTGGTPQVGWYAVGQVSGSRSKVLNIVDAATLDITFESGWDQGFQRQWADGESIVFEDSNGALTGVTAQQVDWIEGNFYPIQKFVKDEWIEGLDEVFVRPGGSKIIPAGYYLRISCWNNSTTDALRVKNSLNFGIE